MASAKRPKTEPSPQRLASQDLAGIADYLSSGQCKSVAFLTGAGISCGAGIPDFRSPGGMYDTLRPDLITASKMQRREMSHDPTYVVTWELFKKNQIPYLEVRRPFILGVLSEDEPAWKPTAAHMFMKVLHDKGLLRCAFTQNIDGLDYHTGLPADAICPVHGSIGKVACEMCGKECGNKWFHDQVVENIKDIYAEDPANSLPTKSTKIACPSCGKFGVKPATVLYGRDLPAEFFERKPKVLSSLDLLFVAGTSLVVGPANTIAEETEESTVRCLVNMEKVGEELGMFNAGREDVFCKADVDDTFIKLAELCGWLPDLANLTDGMASGSKAKVFESMARLSAHEPHRKKE